MTAPAAPSRAAGNPDDWGLVLPSVDAIVASAGGSDARDRANRQRAALEVWRDFVEDLSGNELGPAKPSASAALAWRAYKAEVFERFRYGADSHPYVDSPEFRTQTLAKVFQPDVLEAYAKLRARRAQAILAAKQAPVAPVVRRADRPAGGPRPARADLGIDDRELVGMFLGLMAADGMVTASMTDEEREAMLVERKRQRDADPYYTPNDYTPGTAADERRQRDELEATRRKIELEEQRRRQGLPPQY